MSSIVLEDFVDDVLSGHLEVPDGRQLTRCTDYLIHVVSPIHCHELFVLFLKNLKVIPLLVYLACAL